MKKYETRKERQQLVDSIGGLLFAIIVSLGLLTLAGVIVWALLFYLGVFGAAILGGFVGAAIADFFTTKWVKRGK